MKQIGKAYPDSYKIARKLYAFVTRTDDLKIHI